MLAQAVGRLGAEVEHLSPAAQNKKLVDIVRFIWKPGIWFDKFCVVRLVKAVNRKRLRTVFHKIVPQLMRQRNGQRGNARGVEVKLRAVLHPSVDRSRIRRFADRVHVPAEQHREIAHTIPVRSPFAAEHLGPDIRQRRLVIAVAVGRIVHSPENQRERQYTGNAASPFVKSLKPTLDYSKIAVEPLFEEFVDFDTFSKSDFRAVKVKACEAVKKSKKLLNFTLDDGTGTDRTILSGIHDYYEPEDLVGKTLLAITNLPPRKMMGIPSCGMLISAVHEEEGEERLNLIQLDASIPAGAKMY